MELRFIDRGASIHAFVDGCLVVCPRCGRCAVSRKLNAEPSSTAATRRASCTSCGFTREWNATSGYGVGPNPTGDPYFGLPLWLQARCCGEVLWAYNLEHLTFIEAFVQAKHRERSRGSATGWANRSLASRLPVWVKNRENRDEVLHTVATLRKKASGA